jgi:hypothetical protein
MKIDLMGSLKMLAGLLGVFAVYKIAMFIYLLVVGVTANVALSGSVAVPTAINTTINNTLTSANTSFGLFNSADAFILGLIALVVILKVFWPFISSAVGGKKKSKDSGMGGAF